MSSQTDQATRPFIGRFDSCHLLVIPSGIGVGGCCGQGREVVAQAPRAPADGGVPRGHHP